MKLWYFCGDGCGSGLIERVQPGFLHAFGRNAQGAVGKRFGAAIELLQIGRDGFGRGPKKPAQFRFDIKFPFGANLGLRGGGRRTENSLLGWPRRPLDVAAWNFPSEAIPPGTDRARKFRGNLSGGGIPSASVCSLERGQQQVAVELLDIKLGALPHAAPQNGAAELMDFEHVFLGFFFR